MKISGNGKAEPLTHEQFLELFQILRQPYRTILAICWYTTERAGAVCQLRTEHCYYNGKVRPVLLIPGRIRKDRKTREVPVSQKLKRILQEYYHENSVWMFPSRNPALPIKIQVYARHFKAACQKLGLIGYSTHSARRGAITRLASLGVNSRFIQALSGHQTLDMIQAYCDVRREDVEMVADLL